MRICGEAFLCVNGWMDFLCLLLAARLGRSRFSAGKALISAGLGAVYGAAAWSLGEPGLRGVPALALVCLGMALIAFGRRGPRLFLLVMAAGWLLSGLSDFVLKRGLPSASVIGIDSGAALGVLLLTRRIGGVRGGHCSLRIDYKRGSVAVSALRDTGNLLTDGVSALPVIVLPLRLAKPFLPPGTRADDLSTLPSGWRLVRAKTAAGVRTLMCFTPDQIVISRGKRVWRAEAAVAVSDFDENSALLPESLFYEPEEETCHAVL